MMSDEPQQNGKCLLKMQIGPVQEFIAQARSTRDLWSGSYLLSWLMAAGLRALEAQGANIIYPVWQEQPLRTLLARDATELEKCTIPNLPNVLLASVLQPDPKALALAVEKAIRAEWLTIANAVWEFCHDSGVILANRDRYQAQVGHFLSIAWQITPWEPQFSGDWGAWTQANGHQLASVRQTHAFNAWNSGGWHAAKANNKDSLNGRDEAVAGGPRWRKELPAQLKPFFKHEDWIGAITLIKRLWHVGYLPKWGFKKDHFKMPSTVGIASHDPFATQAIHDEDEEPKNDDLAGQDTYFAVLAFDGDKMGERIHQLRSPGEHTAFSQKLGIFALHEVSPIVVRHQGRIIYAGGDDVLALLPADMALNCGEALQKAFQKATGCTASAGIAFAHCQNPLQDVVRAAQAAEQRAKRSPETGGLGRSAVAITLFKRSGETVEWGCQWAGGGLKLFGALTEALASQKLSAKFTYALIELLRPYRMASTPLMEQGESVKAANGFKVAEVIGREFAHTLGRQHGPKFPKDKDQQESLGEQLTSALEDYLSTLKSHSIDRQLQDVIGLCQTVAFAPAQNQAKNRNGKGSS